MADATDANKGFWAFVFYLKNNPFKSAGGMTNDDIDNMAETFAAANSTEITDATQQLGTFTNYEWPDASGGASSLTAIGTTASINAAHYPEEHQST